MEVLLGLGVALLGQFIKRYLTAYTSIVTHAVVFFLALVAVCVWQYAQYDPSFMAVLMTAGKVLLTAVGVYEVLLKRLGFSALREL